MKPAVLLVGCGRMGSALLGGWLDQGCCRSIAVVEPQIEAIDPGLRARCDKSVSIVHHADAIPAGFAPDVIVVAVKPQMLEQTLPGLREHALRGVILSIVAGKPFAVFERLLPPGVAVIRSMPNTPAAVRRGITVLVANASATAGQRELCGALMAAVGSVDWIADETLLDAVTAVSGSGPAYVFLLIEALASAGAKSGLPESLAARLAAATVAGAGELARLSSLSPAELRHNVTSPNGTTAAALGVLMADPGLQALMDEAVAAATRRSRELAG